MFNKKISLNTRGRGSYDMTREVQQAVADSHVDAGLCHIFVHHTSASLMLCENADPDVRADLERFMARLVPDGDPLFEHTDEGPDDMSAHVRTILTSTGLSIPISQGRCDLGTWQGIYLWEHRTHGYQRSVSITVLGDN